MIIEEGTVIILDDGNRYFLAHEIGEIEGYPNKMYYFASGVTENDKINTNDICFIEIERDNEGYFATKVKRNTEIYDILNSLEALSTLAEVNPMLKDAITKYIEKLEKECS